MSGKTTKSFSEVSSLVNEKVTFKLDYNALYERLCATACQEPPMLLLYLLLHRNSGFRNFVLSRINLENLVSGGCVVATPFAYSNFALLVVYCTLRTR